MGKTRWANDRFGRRLKAERERRGWTQAELAQLITDQDIGIGMHWTTIAKIERGDRLVKIDEAMAIADLFDESVDELLGRQRKEDRGLYPLRLLKDAARLAESQVASITASLSERLGDVGALDFDGREALIGDGQFALEFLQHAGMALNLVAGFGLPAEATTRPPDDEAFSFTGGPETRSAVQGITRSFLAERHAALNDQKGGIK